jgi:hypothetical protein
VTAGAALSLAAAIPGLDLRRPPSNGGRRNVPPIVVAPEQGAYLGAFVNTLGTRKGGTFQVVLENLPAFTQQMGRKPAIVPAYQPWAKPWARNENLTKVVSSYGAAPLVSWHCGAPDDEIVAGEHDALITDFARQMKAYGGPVLLRWYWEPNISNYPACRGPGSLADQAANYVSAYRRIVRIFDREHADNVTFVWSASTLTSVARMKMFYPGDKYVDWIGADGYDREQRGRSAFAEQFSPWYALFASRGKPMMITETGATTDQREYLEGAADVMPDQFPEVKAFLYFDSVGFADWRLSSYGGAGLTAFAELGHNPYFAPMPKV